MNSATTRRDRKSEGFDDQAGAKEGSPRPEAVVGARPSRRSRLLVAGLNAFSTRPYDDVLVTEIAADAGVAAGLPYHYFKSKRGLYLAVLSYVSVELRDVFETPPTMAKREAVRSLLSANLDWLGTHNRVLADLVHGSQSGDPEVKAIFDDVRWDGARQLLAIVGCGELDSATRYFIGGWISLKDEAMLSWLEHPDLDRHELIELLAQLFADVLERVTRITGVATVELADIR